MFSFLISLALFVLTLLTLPYNVERPARRAPNITYALIAINVLVFLCSSAYSNYCLYADAPAVHALMERVEAAEQSDTPPLPTDLRFEGVDLSQLNPDDPDSITNPVLQRFAWTYNHLDDVFTFDVHPNTTNILAYRAGAPYLWTILTSMFLHGDLEHILGNMLMLWVFGRAVEDTLGEKLYAPAYGVCGFAALLMFHLMTQTFAPKALMYPFLGASGAIAGVQGLFAPRFYRTPVKMMYLNWSGIVVFLVGSSIVGGILNALIGSSGAVLGAIAVRLAIYLRGEGELWGTWKLPAAWVISAWIVIFNLVPALLEIATGKQGSVAYWAHIGGLGCGVIYALIIGSQREGTTEYLVDDARSSLDNAVYNGADTALDAAKKVVQMKPDDPVGYQLLAEAHTQRGDREAALKNYALAIGKFLKSKENAQGANLYLEAAAHYPDWVLPPKIQMALGQQMMRRSQWRGAAETIVKLAYYHPNAPQSEAALLRGAQIYLERLDDPIVARQLLDEFIKRFPDSQWRAQVDNWYQIASAQQT